MGDRSFWELCRDLDIEGVQAAIDNGADVNEKGHLGESGLMWACQNNGLNQNNMVQLLLNHPQIDVNTVNQFGDCALHYAMNGIIVENHVGMAAVLARQDLTTINQKTRLGQTPIMMAIENNRVNCFNLLLADPRVDLDGRLEQLARYNNSLLD